MIPDSQIRQDGMQALIDNLGMVEAERFIALMLREPFDYTEWQKTLWADKTPDDILQDMKTQDIKAKA